MEQLTNNRFEEATAGGSDYDKKKKRKRNGQSSYLDLDDNTDANDEYLTPAGRPDRFDLEALQNPYGNRYDYSFQDVDDSFMNQCPVLDAIDKRCQSVDLLSGGANEFNRDLLMPACGAHQFCYLCVSALLERISGKSF